MTSEPRRIDLLQSGETKKGLQAAFAMAQYNSYVLKTKKRPGMEKILCFLYTFRNSFLVEPIHNPYQDIQIDPKKWEDAYHARRR